MSTCQGAVSYVSSEGNGGDQVKTRAPEKSGSGIGGWKAPLLALLLCSTAPSYGQSVTSESAPSYPASSDCNGFEQLAGVFGSSATATSRTPKSACGHASTQQTVVVNGVTRTFMLYVPDNYQPSESALIIALHGRGQSVADMESGSHLDDKANQEGFAVAYPVGFVDAFGTANWNYFYDPFFVNAPDDVSFLRTLIDTLQAQIHPDRRRIYVAGGSAGGFMVQRAAVELSDRVAAVGVVEGGLFVFAPNSPQSVPSAAAPISVLFLKGDQDVANQ